MVEEVECVACPFFNCCTHLFFFCHSIVWCLSCVVYVFPVCLSCTHLITSPPESLNNHRLSMERMTTLHTTQIEAIQTNHANKFKSQEEIFSEKLDNGERKYKSMMDLNALTLQVNQCVSNVDSLTSTLATSASSSEQSRLASIEARESLVAEMEKSVRDTKKRSDAEYSRLQSMLATLEITQERLTSSTNEDRIRLREEHARLEAGTDTVSYFCLYCL
mgnify:CR=1 FL=1